MRLEHFVTAQDPVFDQVCAELKAGNKQSHWMWFVFPQLAGLGSSPMAQRFGITGIAQAGLYLAHFVLGHRLQHVTRLMLQWSGRRSAAAILGPVDAMKFCSSMTLFEVAAHESGGSADFGHAIDAFCQGRRDDRTLSMLHISAQR